MVTCCSNKQAYEDNTTGYAESQEQITSVPVQGEQLDDNRMHVQVNDVTWIVCPH
jgi:hypothetical protein